MTYMNDTDILRIVADTDVLVFLKGHKLGKEILDHCWIYVPETVYQEEYAKSGINLENITKVVLSEKDKERAGKILGQIYKRETGKRYLVHRFRPDSTGECENAAIAIQLQYPLVLLDESRSIVRNALGINKTLILTMKELGELVFIKMLNDEEKSEEFRALIKEKLNIF